MLNVNIMQPSNQPNYRFESSHGRLRSYALSFILGLMFKGKFISVGLPPYFLVICWQISNWKWTTLTFLTTSQSWNNVGKHVRVQGIKWELLEATGIIRGQTQALYGSLIAFKIFEYICKYSNISGQIIFEYIRQIVIRILPLADRSHKGPFQWGPFNKSSNY